MKLKRRRALEVPSKIKTFISNVIGAPPENIEDILKSFYWAFDKGDFHHWVDLFNYFDTYFEKYIKPRKDLQLEDNSLESDPPFPREAVLHILRVIRIILENCTNKHLYSSYEHHLSSLLSSTDPDVVGASLQTLAAFLKKSAALLLSYSLIMPNTDQNNTQVKKKMSEDDFIRSNRKISGGDDLPRDFLSDLYHPFCENEILMLPDQGGVTVFSRSHWIGLMHKAKYTSPFIVCDSGSYLDYDMFAIFSGPSVAAIPVVFDHAEQEGVLQSCIDGFLAITKLSASYSFVKVLDDLVVSLCKFTTLLIYFLDGQGYRISKKQTSV